MALPVQIGAREYSKFRDVSGNVAIAVVNSDGSAIGTAGAGTSVSPSTYAVDDTAMPATPNVIPAGAEYRASPTTYADGDATVLQSDINGNLKVTLATTIAGEDIVNDLQKVGGNVAHDAIDVGGPVKIGGYASAAAPSAVSADADRVNAWFDRSGRLMVGGGKFEDGASADGDSGFPMLAVRKATPANTSGTDGDYEFLQMSTGRLWTLPSDTVAHDDADAGNGIKMTSKAKSSPKGLTLVSDGDRTDQFSDIDGLQMVKLNTSNADIISERVSNTDGNSTAFTNFSAVASTKNYVTSISVYNSSATAGYVDFRSGTSGTVLWTMALPAGGGSIISSASPLFATAANTALAFDVSAALTTVYISVSGFQSKA